MKYWKFIFELFLFLSTYSVVSCNVYFSRTIEFFYSDLYPILSSSSLYLSESISHLYGPRWEFDPYHISSSLSSFIYYFIYSSLSSFINIHILFHILLPFLYPDYQSSNSFDFLPILFHLVKQGNTKPLPYLIRSICYCTHDTQYNIRFWLVNYRS